MFRKSSFRRMPNGFLFRLAPFLALVPSLATWAVIRCAGARVCEYRCGLLYILALTSMGGTASSWPLGSQLQVCFLGAMRSAAQIVGL